MENLTKVLNGQNENFILPFLWIRGESRETYRKMINVIHSANIKAFCVEARPHDKFCEKEWFDDLNAIIEEAKKLDMRVWILDDKKFPTGYANGEVLNAPLSLRRQSVFCVEIPHKGNKLKANLKKFMKIRKNLLYKLSDRFNKNKIKQNRFKDDRIISLAAISEKGKNIVDLTAKIKKNNINEILQNNDCKVYLTFATRNAGARRAYINMLEKDSCKILLDAVYEKHYEKLKDEFGKTIAGFFSDEPELGNGLLYKGIAPGDKWDYAWSGSLEKLLSERFGKDYAAYLPLLWENGYDENLTAKIRFEYMNAVTDLVSESFTKQVGAWCKEHGVEHIGHVIEDNGTHSKTGAGLGHYFKAVKNDDMAGIDIVLNQITPYNQNLNFEGKFGFLGKVNGKFFHYALAKLASSAAALDKNKNNRAMCELFGAYGWSEGIRLEKYLTDHCLVRGINRFVPHAFTCRDYPDKDCPPHFYAMGNDPQFKYFGKLMQYTNRLCELFEGCKNTAARAGVYYNAESEWSGAAMALEAVSKVLFESQKDFFFLPLSVFEENNPDVKINKLLTVNGHDFETIIVPQCRYIPRELLQSLQLFKEKGGEVLFINYLPSFDCGGNKIDIDFPVVKLEDLASHLQNKESPFAKIVPADKSIRLMQLKNTDGNEILFCFNEGKTAYDGEIKLAKSTNACEYDAFENQIYVCGNNTNDGVLQIELKLLPQESKVYILSGEKLTDNIKLQPFKNKTALKRFKISACKSIEYPNFKFAKNAEVPESYHLTAPSFSGFVAYETVFDNKHKQAFIEIEDVHEAVELFINGKSAGQKLAAPFVFNISPLLKAGENTLRAEVATTLERENSKKPATVLSKTGICGNINLSVE